METVEKIKIDLNWYIQVIEHIKITLENKTMSNSDKVESIRWLVRQLDSESKND